MFLNLFGSDGPLGAHTGDYRNRVSIAVVRSSWSLPHCRNNGLRLEIGNARAIRVLVNSCHAIRRSR